jgi:hypothetical protein
LQHCISSLQVPYAGRLLLLRLRLLLLLLQLLVAFGGFCGSHNSHSVTEQKPRP